MTSFSCINYFVIIFIRTFICTGVIVLRLLFIYFQFWDGVQHSFPKDIEVHIEVLRNIIIK